MADWSRRAPDWISSLSNDHRLAAAVRSSGSERMRAHTCKGLPHGNEGGHIVLLILCSFFSSVLPLRWCAKTRILLQSLPIVYTSVATPDYCGGHRRDFFHSINTETEILEVSPLANQRMKNVQA
jgi:hypothetical protein